MCSFRLIFFIILFSLNYQCVAKTQIEKCLLKTDAKKCWSLDLRFESSLFKEPDTSSKIIRKWPAGTPVGIDWKVSKKHGNKLFVFNTLPGEQGSDYEGWIETKNIASPFDARRVVGCWPIEYFSDEGQLDYDIKIKLDVNGRGKTESDGKVAYVWFTPNLVYFGVKPSQGYMYVYDPETRQLIQPSGGYVVKNVRYFSEEKLTGCNGQLRLK